MIIPLRDALLRRFSNLPAGFGPQAVESTAESLRLGASGRYALRRLERSGEIPAYLVLLRVGFTVPRPLLNARCALTAPFHPYPEPLSDLPRQITNSGRYILCCTGRPAALTRPSRTLSGTLPCGVRTFLPRLTPFGLSLRVKT